MKKFLTLVVFVLLAAVGAHSQERYIPTEQNIGARAEFEDQRFGVFIHWGIYSQLGKGEWAMNNLNLNYQEYAKLAGGFDPKNFNAEEWVKAIKASGAKYITITSRHHDGFSMWNTKVSDFNIVKATPYGKDVLKALAKACNKYDIQLNFYYSHLDWSRTDFWPRGRTGNGTGRPDGKDTDWREYCNFIDSQLVELLTKYGRIGAIWFDGVWDKDAYPREKQPELWNLYEQYQIIHSIQPSCLIGNNHHLLPFGGEDIQIFERDIPGHNDAGLSGQAIASLPLETCQTMNDSWGYNENDHNYKSTEDLIRYLVKTAGKGANLLLNIGPKPDGTLPQEAVERLYAIGQWMNRFGDSIYYTDGGIISEQPWGVTTQRGNKLYVHVLNHDYKVFLPITDNALLSAELFDTHEAVNYKLSGSGITLDLPDTDEVDQVVTLTFERPLAATIPIHEQYVSFLYNNMSVADSVTYSRDFWERNALKTVEVRENMGWNVPENEFRHFVLPLRVNNEYLDDFRTTYADTLCARVKGMSMADAALEINHWCHEQATYRPADARTSAPMAIIRTGFGRCGEESVLAVSALRAAGIPARQVYTPRWAHTDDNHAWVEVYIDGKWHFMGACEPEPVLDKAWFNAPVSRAMLLHTKAFGHYYGTEGVIQHTPAFTEINVTSNYVPTRRTTVQVVDLKGQPVVDAQVTFKIYNYAEFYTVATYKTDEKGMATLETGLGDILVWAEKDGRFSLTKLNSDFTILMLDHRLGEEFSISFDILPPAENPLPADVTEEQAARNSERLAYEDSIRKPVGNQAVLDAFIAKHPENQQKCKDILASLTAKDLEDVSLDVLEDTYRHAGDVFNPLTDCPRVEIEYLYPYFSEIGQGLNLSTPQEVRSWVDRHIKLDEVNNPQGLRIPPVMVWRSRVADAKSRDIFYVALCRALGIPAALDAVTGKTSSGVDQRKKGVANFEYEPVQSNPDPEYYRHFTISKIEDGATSLLSYSEDEALPLSKFSPQQLEEGYYVLTTGTRMADGSVLAHMEFFEVTHNNRSDVTFEMRESKDKISVLGSFYAEPYIPVTGRGYFAMVIMGDKDEPTVHAVKDINSIAKSLNDWDRKILVWGKNRPKGLKNAVFYDYDPAVPQTLAEGVRRQSFQLPVVAIVDTFGRIVYYSQGYNTSLKEDLQRVINQL